MEVPVVEHDEGLGLTLLGVVSKVDLIAEVVLALSNTGGVDITVVGVDSLARVLLLGVVGKVGVPMEVGLTLSDIVAGAIGVGVGMDVGVDITVVVIDILA